MKTNDTLLLMLPDDMQPLAFREELCVLDSTLRVVLDHEPHDPAEVGFIVGWKRPEDGWDKYPNLRAVHSFGAGVDQLLKGYILRGAALGVFAGLAYGFWDAQQGDAFSQHTPKGLLHWNHGAQQLALRPAQLAPEWSVDADSGVSQYQFRIFTAEF